MRKRLKLASAGLLALTLGAAACGDDDDDDTAGTGAPTGSEAPATSAAPGTTAATGTTAGTEGSGPAAECDAADEVVLQLQWEIQAQFAGYLAADDQGFYEEQCLDVSFLEAGVDIVPQQVLADGQADFAIAWVPKALQTREQGANIVNIAQMFQRSGTLQVSFVDEDITTPEDFAGKNIGNWGFGNEYEIFAALGEAGLDPASDVTLVQQQFDMNALLAGDIDAAEAMTYNEYARVLEAENPETGELYQPEDFNVISYEDVGVGMLQARSGPTETGWSRTTPTGTSRRASSPPRSRDGRTAATTPRPAATSWSPPDPNSATAISCGR
jgi:NitT/TauT family transport system substrate-binding protein